MKTMKHYSLEFIFGKAYYDRDYEVNFTDGNCDISCIVNGQESIPLDITDLALNEYNPYYAKGVDYTFEYQDFYIRFELDLEEFDIRKVKFYTYGITGYMQYINIEILRYEGKDYQYTQAWDE